MKLTALIIGLVLSGCVSSPMYNIPDVEPLYQEMGITEQGYWVIITSDQKFVGAMCGDYKDPYILGCARWPGAPEVLPAKACLIGIYAPLNSPQEYVDDIFIHEMNHCLLGSWHNEDGKVLPEFEGKLWSPEPEFKPGPIQPNF